MKKFLLLLSLSLLLVSCGEKEPQQYQLTSADVQKMEELACHLLYKYDEVQSGINFVHHLQTNVTVPAEQLMLAQTANSAKEDIWAIKNALETLEVLGVKCKGSAAEIKEEQASSRMQFLGALQTNIESVRGWRNGLKARAIEDVNAQAEEAKRLSKQMK